MKHLSLLVALLVSIVPEPAPMKFTTLDRGVTSRIETSRTIAVRTAAEWAALWKEHAGDSKPPAVDFSKAMVIGVFAGMRPTGGHAMEITQIDARDGDVMVTYRELRPGPDDITTQALTYPFHLVRTERRSGKVTFERAR
jgi:hypothetical protein